MQKNKSITTIVLFFIALICVCMCVILGNGNNVVFAGEQPASIEELCRTYTDSVNPKGISFYDYIDEFQDSLDNTWLDIGLNFTNAKMKTGNYFNNNMY